MKIKSNKIFFGEIFSRAGGILAQELAGQAAPDLACPQLRACGKKSLYTFKKVCLGLKVYNGKRCNIGQWYVNL